MKILYTSAIRLSKGVCAASQINKYIHDLCSLG